MRYSFLSGAFLVFAAIFATEPVFSQSFDCRVARDADEILICKQPGLRKLDNELQSLYERKLDAAPKFLRPMIRAEQEAWVWSRQTCQNDERCVRGFYRARMRELRSVLQQAKRPETRPTPRPVSQGHCTIYRAEQLRGEGTIIRPNTKIPVMDQGWNNSISSIRTSFDCELIAYKGAKFQGFNKTYKGKAKVLHPSLNNKISSIWCSCR